MTIEVQLSKRDQSIASSSLVNKGPTPSIGQRQALEEYTSAARRLWDIVDLAGLPEDDRHLAMQRSCLASSLHPVVPDRRSIRE